MPAGMATGSLSQIVPAEFLGLSASVWFWIALAGWATAIVVGFVLATRADPARVRGQAPAAPAVERVELDTPDLLRAITPDEDAVGGVLRWLLGEVEADAVALLELAPAGETLRIEPRGLDGTAVADLVAQARRLLLGGEEPRSGVAIVRWLGAGGTNLLMATGTSVGGGQEPFRFSRYLLEWVRASERRKRPQGELEDRLRAVEGVAWVELLDESARLVPSERSNVERTRLEVDRELEGTGLVAEWIQVAEAPRGIEARSGAAGQASQRDSEAPVAEAEEVEAQLDDQPLVSSALGTQEPRIRLLDVALSENGDATADVRVTWNDREIRGRGHGRATRAGRYFAAAQAVADALRPLLDTDVVVEGLYVATTKEGVDVLISEVRMEGERFVGAVLERRDRPDWTGARAVLDAVNRRLVQLAGRSGRV